jgi:hypothetical protein
MTAGPVQPSNCMLASVTPDDVMMNALAVPLQAMTVRPSTVMLDARRLVAVSVVVAPGLREPAIVTAELMVNGCATWAGQGTESGTATACGICAACRGNLSTGKCYLSATAPLFL